MSSSPDPSTYDGSTVESVFLVLSHVIFLLPLISNLKRRLFFFTSLTAGVLIFSTQYHMCRARWTCLGFESLPNALDATRQADHIFSTYAAMGSILTAATSDTGGGAPVILLRLLLLMGVYYSHVAFPFQAHATYASVSVLAVMIVAHVFLVARGNLPTPRDRFVGLALVLAVLFGLVGYVFFVIPGLPYWSTHTVWHVCIALSLFFIGEAVSKSRGEPSWIPWHACCSASKR